MGGVVLILLGTMFLAANFIPDVHFHDLWPLLLIGIGAVLLWNSRGRKPQ
jgi:thiol:disulfide interchange protein